MPTFARYLSAVLALSYPWAAWIAASRHSAALTLFAVALLLGAMLLPSLVRMRRGAWFALPLVAAGLWLLGQLSGHQLLLYLPPVLIPGFLAWVFGHTLAKARTPLIEQFVRAMHAADDDIEPGVWPYARRLTLAWTVLLATIAAVNLILATLVTPEGLLMAAGIVPPIAVTQAQWSTFANLIGYLLIGSFFVIEYAYRRRRFRQPYRNFFDFLCRTIAVSPRLVSPGRSQ
ncbi:hypothetical protein [Povalibacter sp.]|uniref:hypothetical protein n=1 Tax=Povalibacter sp. TaxID=1962978 RepID=UPI002F410F1C